MANPFSNKSVLVAENTAPVRQLIVSELNSLGFEPENIQEAENGIEAVNLLLKKEFDIIISELNLPKMDGLTVLKKARSLKDYMFTPFLVITAEADLQKKKEALEAGADNFIRKPFPKNVFHEVISKLILPQKKYGDKKVLIIDDSPTIRTLIFQNLIQAGFEESNIFQAANGEEGIKNLKSQNISLVVLDWHMPVMNGFEFTEIVRNKFSKEQLPILMISTEADKTNVIKVFQKGINAYIIKPFTTEDIESKIRSIFPETL